MMGAIVKKAGMFAVRTAKNTVIGGAAGYLAGGFTATSEHKDSAAEQGAIVGAAAAGLATVAMGAGAHSINRVARSAYGGILKLGKKVGRASPIPEGKLARGLADGIRKGRVTFRRIRGRLVPIRVK